MLKKAMLGVVLGLSMAPMVAMAGTMHLPGNEALVHVNTPGSSLPVVLKKGVSAPVTMVSSNGQQWEGIKGSVRDMGKAVAYRFQIRGAYSGKAEIVHGLRPLRNGVATIALRPGIVPAVKG
ncbi:MAG: hypothetical protein ACYCS8_00040 [Acidithiobacillus sp.]